MNNYLYLKQKISMKETSLIYVLVTLSLAIAAWIQYIQFGRINIDSVLYLESAKSISLGNWNEAYKIYNWPFYSCCIALVHVVTKVSIEQSAQILNVIFFGITTYSFLKIINILGGNKAEVIFGALILFSTRHIVGTVLAIPIRDEGFWAFYLTAILFLIKFIHNQHLPNAMLWQVAIILATLFRIEGALYLVLLPFVIFFIPALNQKFRSFVSCFIIIIPLILSIFLFSQLLDNNLHNKIGRLQELNPAVAIQEVTLKLISKSQIMSVDVLGRYLSDYAIESLLISFLMIIFAKSTNTIGLINLGLFIQSFKYRKELFIEKQYYVLIAACLISILSMLFITIKSFVLVGRYTVPLAITLLILSSFSIRIFYKPDHKHRLIKRIFLVFLGLFMLLNISKNLYPYHHKPYYIIEAVNWLRNHNIQKEPVLYDNILSRYYAGEPYQAEPRDKVSYLRSQTNSKDFNRYKFILVEYNNSIEASQKLELINLVSNAYKEIKRFHGAKSSELVIIYEKS